MIAVSAIAFIPGMIGGIIAATVIYVRDRRGR